MFIVVNCVSQADVKLIFVPHWPGLKITRYKKKNPKQNKQQQRKGPFPVVLFFNHFPFHGFECMSLLYLFAIKQLSWFSADSYMKHPLSLWCSDAPSVHFPAVCVCVCIHVCVHNCKCVRFCVAVCASFSSRELKVDAHTVAVQRWRSWLVQNWCLLKAFCCCSPLHPRDH